MAHRTVGDLGVEGAFLGPNDLRGTLAARPAAAARYVGWFYLATDTSGGTLYRCHTTGAPAWEQVAAGVTDPAKTFNTTMSFTRGEDDQWPLSAKIVGHFRVRKQAGQTVSLVTAEHKLDSGASTVLKVQKNGVDITGWTAIAPSTTEAQTNPADEVLADGDRITVVCTTQGTGKGGYFELVLLHSVT